MKKSIIFILIYVFISLILITINSIPVKKEKIEIMIQQEIEEMKVTREEHKLNISDENIEKTVRERYEDRSTFSERFIDNSKLFLIGLGVIIIWLLIRFCRRKERRTDHMLNYKE